MSIRQMQATVTAPDPYGTPRTFYKGQILDISPGSVWETAILAAGGVIPVLTGTPLADDQQGDGDPTTAGNG